MTSFGKHYLSLFIIFFIFFVGFSLRFYNLSSVPNGLYPDETALGYNAYSILQTGRDEYGKQFPIYFRSFDDYKLPVYIYSTAASIKLFGVNAFAVRLPSALIGSLTVIGIYFLIYEISKNRRLSALTSLGLALNPWHVFFSRAGYEVNLATSLVVFGMLFFVFAVNRKNNFFLFILSVLMFILSAYTYNVTRLISPLIFMMLIIFYYRKITSESKTTLITMLGLFFAGMLPILIASLGLQQEPGFSSHQDALIIGTAMKAELIETRSYFISLPAIIQKVFFNYWFLLAWTYIKNLVSFFSTSFFFILGSDRLNQNIGGGMSMFYYFEFPLILIGAYQGIKNKIKFLYPFYLWFLITLLIGATLKVTPNGTKTYIVIIPLIIFSSYGLYFILNKISSVKPLLLKRSILVLGIMFILYSYLFYFTSYFIRFPVELAKDWRSEDEKAVAYINSVEKDYKKIVFDENAGFYYTSLLFYGKYSPQHHQKEAVYKLSGLVNAVSKTGKYEFRKIDWAKDMKEPGTLFFSAKYKGPANRRPIAIFRYPSKPVAIFHDRTISQLPFSEIAYEVYKSGEE